MFDKFRNLPFWKSAKTLPLVIKTPGVLYGGDDVY